MKKKNKKTAQIVNQNANLPVPANSLEKYLTEISNYEILSREEEYDYAKQYRESGDIDAARKLFWPEMRSRPSRRSVMIGALARYMRCSATSSPVSGITLELGARIARAQRLSRPSRCPLRRRQREALRSATMRSICGSTSVRPVATGQPA